jgi:hypothetical protein
MKITPDMLLNPEYGISQATLDLVVQQLLAYLPPLDNSFVVLPFCDVPKDIRDVFHFNGGDEDWFVITRKEPSIWTLTWLTCTDSCEQPDVYLLDGVIVYVGTHA